MAAIPTYVRAVIDALQFVNPRPEALSRLTPAEWRDVLRYCDESRLTLALLDRAAGCLPPDIRGRLESNRDANVLRHAAMQAVYREVAAALQAAGIEFVVLKGTTQAPWFAAAPTDRMSYDLDLYCLPDTVIRARDQLVTLGYESLEGFDRFPLDHLPALIRKSGWEWRGDYFDLSLPIAVELHFRFWCDRNERFSPSGLDDFWQRRVVEGGTPTLHPWDRVAYACLHLLRHTLRGNTKPCHFYEMAWFLQHHAGNEDLWRKRLEWHSEDLRKLQCVGFSLARRWFGCSLNPALSAEIESLPHAWREWVAHYGLAPLEGRFRPNKHELWLHLELLDNWRDRRAVLLRRLAPRTLPGPVDAVTIPESQLTPWIRVRRRLRYARHISQRLIHHLRALPSVILHGTRWQLQRQGLASGYTRFLSSAWLYELGMFVFVLLYNLRLLELGFKEDLIGTIAAAQTAGSVAGALPAGWLLQRIRIGQFLRYTFALLGALLALRSIVAIPSLLILSAFAAGAVMSAFTVAFAPAIARLTTPGSRPFGYGLFFSSGIAMGILGGGLGGHLPGWLGGYQPALLAGSVLVVIAAWPVGRLSLPGLEQRERNQYPRSPVFWKFLAAIVVWNLATGSFNPFFNAYLTGHWKLSVERVGGIFSLAQAMQVAAMLLAPIALRRFGLITAISFMQLATGLALAALAISGNSALAASLYVAYMAFQWMSEPGIYSVLMNPLRPSEMGGAAALYMLATLSAQSAAASMAGFVIARGGYSPLLNGASAGAVLASLIFWLLLRRTVVSNKVSI